MQTRRQKLKQEKEELAKCSFSPHINFKRSPGKPKSHNRSKSPKVSKNIQAQRERNLPVEERLLQMGRKTESKIERIRRLQDITMDLQAQQRLCSCFDLMSPNDRKKVMRLKGIGDQVYDIEDTQGFMGFQSEVELEHRPDCSSRKPFTGVVMEDGFIEHDEKTSKSIAKHLRVQERARRLKTENKKRYDRFVRLRPYAHHGNS